MSPSKRTVRNYPLLRAYDIRECGLTNLLYPDISKVKLSMPEKSPEASHLYDEEVNYIPDVIIFNEIKGGTLAASFRNSRYA